MNDQNPPTLGEVAAEVMNIRRELEEVKAVVQENRGALQSLIFVFNERLTDLYGEIEHVKQYGSNANNIPRQRTILRDFFNTG